jgi:phage gp36-like protein
MSILTQTQIEQRVAADELVRLTDDSGAGAVDTDVLARAVEAGESEVLGLVGQRYQLPLSMTHATTVSMVQTKLLDAVVYRLYLHRDQVIPETIRDCYKDAIRWAESIAKGDIGLINETQQSASPAGGGEMLIVSSDQVVSRESMAGL